MGVNIIRVDKINNEERGSYDDSRTEIRRKILGEKKNELRDASNAYIESVFDREKMVYHEENINTFWELMKTIGNPQISVVRDTLAAQPDTTLEKALCTFKGGSITFADFYERLKKAPGHAVIPKDMPERYKNIVKQWKTNDFLVKDAKRKNLDKHPAVRESLLKEQERQMLTLLERNIMMRDIEPTEEEIRAHYEANKKEKYTANGNVTPYEQIEGRIKSDLMRTERSARVEEWNTQQREKYDIQINNNILHTILEENKSDA